MRFLLCLALALPCAAFAKMDVAANRAQDQTIRYEVLNKEPARAEPKKMDFEVRLKGDKSFTEFHAPGDVKGTKVLVMSRTQMYIWLPQFNKVRRIASHVTEQGFMGTTLTNDDMATLSYGALYAGTLVSEDDESWTVQADPKADAEVVWQKMVFTIRKADTLPSKIEYFNSKGELARTMARSEYSCEGDVCTPRVMRMTDHLRNDAWTELIRTEWEVNTGLDDGIFTVRELQRGG